MSGQERATFQARDAGQTRDAGETGNGAARSPRLVFRAWFIGTAAMMAAALVLGRLIEDDRIGFVFTGVIFPIATAALVFTALVWLARFVFGGGRRN